MRRGKNAKTLTPKASLPKQQVSKRDLSHQLRTTLGAQVAQHPSASSIPYPSFLPPLALLRFLITLERLEQLKADLA